MTGTEWARRRGQSGEGVDTLQSGRLATVRTLASSLSKIGSHCGCRAVGLYDADMKTDNPV